MSPRLPLPCSARVKPFATGKIGPRGFSLVEMLIVLGVISLLIAVALPAYRTQVAKGHRAQARAQLLLAAQFMQSFHAAHDRFDQTREGGSVRNSLPPALAQSPEQGTALYRLVWLELTPTQYRIGMQPVAGAAMQSDRCGTFTLDASGARGLDGAAGNDASLREECWR
ncbi:MAG: prepilin-type N-terminal cleavage/methylation domain-containing protein [Betaproteobacteria bacterium]|jgi:type IV pilus assembly protein PilE|nr:prepilin-type N-terminal cleavage/methylation domain-containing protein [Betaproteobacteria bacterium]